MAALGLSCLDRFFDLHVTPHAPLGRRYAHVRSGEAPGRIGDYAEEAEVLADGELLAQILTQHARALRT